MSDSRPTRVGFSTNMYTPYKEAMLSEIAKLVDLKVYYCAERESDRDWEVKFSETYLVRGFKCFCLFFTWMFDMPVSRNFIFFSGLISSCLSANNVALDVSAFPLYGAGGESSVTRTAPGSYMVWSPERVTGGMQNLLSLSFRAERGGVFQMEEPGGGSTMWDPQDEVWVRYGFRGSKTLVLNCETTANSSLLFTNANSVDSMSGNDILFEGNHSSKGFTIKFNRILSGDLDEKIVSAGLSVLSRDSISQAVRVTGVLNSGALQPIETDVGAGAGEDIVFFGFEAPVGDHITAIQVEWLGSAPDVRLGVDDLFFITDAATDVLNPAPNILLIVYDDLGWPYTSKDWALAHPNIPAPWISTPAFDRIASLGVHFQTAYVQTPSCAPSRASLLTGRYSWTLSEAAILASVFPDRFPTLPYWLEDAGYYVGSSGKGWGPGDYLAGGWSSARPPMGPIYNDLRKSIPISSLSSIDYVANFLTFFEDAQGAPFFYWLGIDEPHAPWTLGSHPEHSLLIDTVKVPSFLPDIEQARDLILSMAYETEYAEAEIIRIIEFLEQSGELEDTLVIAISDNGHSFFGAKGYVREYGLHVPLAISWPRRIPEGQVLDAVVESVDLVPTILEAAKVDYSDKGLHGNSLLPWSIDGIHGSFLDVAYFGFERHGLDRGDRSAYPVRGIRRGDFLYVKNFESSRYPRGRQWVLEAEDVDPSSAESYQSWIQHHQHSDVPIPGNLAVTGRELFSHLLGPWPSEMLFDVKNDPECLVDLALDDSLSASMSSFRNEMDKVFRLHGDPRVLGYGEIFEAYPFTHKSGGGLHESYDNTTLTAIIDWLHLDSDMDGASNLHEILNGSSALNDDSMSTALLRNEGHSIALLQRGDSYYSGFVARPHYSTDLSTFYPLSEYPPDSGSFQYIFNLDGLSAQDVNNGFEGDRIWSVVPVDGNVFFRWQLDFELGALGEYPLE